MISYQKYKEAKMVIERYEKEQKARLLKEANTFEKVFKIHGFERETCNNGIIYTHKNGWFAEIQDREHLLKVLNHRLAMIQSETSNEVRETINQ